MGQFERTLGFYAKVSKAIVSGRKIDPSVYDSDLIQDLEKLAARIYTGFSTPFEPQSLVIQPGWGKKEISFMGNSSIHPISKSLFSAAKAINANETDFIVYGHNTHTRYDVDLNDAYSQRGKKPHLLLPECDYSSLSQVTDDLAWRMTQPEAYKLPPIIVQKKEHWGKLFADKQFNYAELGVHFTNTDQETDQILSAYKDAYPYVGKASRPISNYKIATPQNIFATTDHVKTGQNIVAQSDYKGEIRVAHTVVGSYQIPEEQQFSYAANGWVKIVNIMEIALERGLKDPTGQMNLLANDGGLAGFFMNKKGDVYTNIFTDKKFFPTSAHVMNPILSGPGVELAEAYKSVPNFESYMDATQRKIADVCKHDKRFKPSDFKIFDVATQMSIPLNKFYELYDEMQSSHPEMSRRKICEHIARVHTVSVCDIQQTKLLPTAKFNSVPLTTDTEHFLEAAGHRGKSRAQIPEWVKTGPNAETFRMLMDAISAESSELGNSFSQKAAARPPKIAVPGMLVGNKGKTKATSDLKDALDKLGINFRMGTDYWEKYSSKNRERLAQKFKDAASFHRKNIRDLLHENDFLYIPRDCAPASPREKLEFLLLVSSAMVQRQVFQKDAPFIIMEKGPFADLVISIFKALKNMGLIGQKLEHLVKLTDGPEQSAKEISAIMHLIPPAKRQPTHLHEIKTIPMPENFTAVAYCSASNKNAEWIPETEEIARQTALSGADLKVGGGKEGMMKAAADGYMRGLAELFEQGIEPKGKLHLIQCEATRTIEGEYEIPKQFDERFIEKRCYKTIEERRYDLQKSHFTLATAGGIGTFEEILCELLAVSYGEKDKAAFKAHLLSQSGTLPNGKQGRVYDFMDGIMSSILPHGMMNIMRTPTEMIQLLQDEKTKYDVERQPVLEAHPTIQPTAQIIALPVPRVA